MKDKKPVDLNKRLVLKGLDPGSVKRVEKEIRQQLKMNSLQKLNTAFMNVKCPHCNK